MIPRVMKADAASLLDESGANLDPFKVWDCMMKKEKPGGHGDRAVAAATLDMAIWDACAKIAGVPLYRFLADRYWQGTVPDRVPVYVGGGYYAPGRGLDALQDEIRGHLDDGFTVVKMKIGGAPLAEDMRRIEAASICRPRWNTAVRWRPSACAGTRSPAIRSTSICRRPSRANTRARSPQERICSRPGTRSTSCAMAACAPSATICNSTAR
jgi:hypothetical protein